MQVASALRKGLPEARKALSCIVGRDTENLGEDAVIRAAVETVAENTTDGVVAPLFFLFLGGPAAAMAYKAVNTMDSMIGYKNERYLHFGRAAARLDDVLNFIPARIAALLWIIAAGLCREDRKGAWRIWRRDRFKHESPNSAQTESACAGSLQVALAGDAYYFGKLKRKPVIGDPVREITPDDIRRANRMMTVTSILAMTAGMLIRVSVLWLLR
jgi:adenosylcobinamide-phosphate synthase